MRLGRLPRRDTTTSWEMSGASWVLNLCYFKPDKYDQYYGELDADFDDVDDDDDEVEEEEEEVEAEGNFQASRDAKRVRKA